MGEPPDQGALRQVPPQWLGTTPCQLEVVSDEEQQAQQSQREDAAVAAANVQNVSEDALVIVYIIIICEELSSWAANPGPTHYSPVPSNPQAASRSSSNRRLTHLSYLGKK